MQWARAVGEVTAPLSRTGGMQEQEEAVGILGDEGGDKGGSSSSLVSK